MEQFLKVIGKISKDSSADTLLDPEKIKIWILTNILGLALTFNAFESELHVMLDIIGLTFLITTILVIVIRGITILPVISVEGLQLLEEKPLYPIVIYIVASTKWFMAAFGALSRNIVFSTFHKKFSDDAIIYELNETIMCLVVTSCELLPDQIFTTDMCGFILGAKIESYGSITKMGDTSNIDPASKTLALATSFTISSTSAHGGEDINHIISKEVKIKIETECKQVQNFQFIPFKSVNWLTVCSSEFKKPPTPTLKVSTFKGINFSKLDDAFIVNKKNHFHSTCHVFKDGQHDFISMDTDYLPLEYFYKP